MPKVTAAYRDGRKRQILEAAIACFSRQGLHRTTMQEIIRESKLSAGAIYSYFESKQEIVEALAADRQARERALIAAAETRPDAAQAMDAIRDAFFGPLADPRERRRRRVSIQLWAEAQRNARILDMVRRSVDEPRKLLRGFFVQSQRKGALARGVDPDAAARLMIAVYLGFVLQLEWDEHVRVEPYLALLDLCVRRVFLKSAARAR